jgi:predicted transcriptional regulator YdeE
MDIKIIKQKLHLELYGFGDIATNKDNAATAFDLSGRMWQVVKANGVKNKGKNIWVYNTGNKVFAGVECNESAESNYGLEKMIIDIEKYAYCKHIGDYSLIKQTEQSMTKELIKQGYEISLPYIEIYGHWNKDESKLETELIMCLKKGTKNDKTTNR